MHAAAAAATAPSEQTFDEWRRRVGVWLGPAVFLAVLWSPLGLEAAAQKAAAIVALAVTWWITEAIPLPATALLGPTLAVALGVTSVKEAFAPFADPVIYLFLGSFLIAEALHVHGLDQRIALAVLGLRGVGSSPERVRLAIALVTAGISMWISNTATAAMMLPVVLGIVQALNRAGLEQPPRGFLIVLAYAASIGGIATPVGTPPNLIGLGFLDRLAGRDIDFLSFMAIGLPMALVLSAALVLLARLTGPRQGLAATAVRE
jgi:sodium-dependent dicarboxylate transporter 2/3/5